MKEHYKYDWNQIIRIKTSAPASLMPGEKGVIVGMRTIKSKLESDAVNYPVGTILYSVEYCGSKIIELPETVISDKI